MTTEPSTVHGFRRWPRREALNIETTPEDEQSPTLTEPTNIPLTTVTSNHDTYVDMTRSKSSPSVVPLGRMVKFNA